MMEEDPLIPLVHVWNNAAFDDSSSSSASAWHAHATPARLTARGDKENRRPQLEDVDAEIDHIEAEILRLSSRLHHLRTSRGLDTHREPVPVPAAAKAQPQPRPRARGLSLGPLDVACAANPTMLVPDKQQPPPPHAASQRTKPTTKQQQQAPAVAARGRGLSLGPLDIAAANPTTKLPSPRQPQQQVGVAAASRILKPIKEPPVQRRRGVSLGPMEIQHGISGKPAAARAKPFPNKLNAIREEGQSSRQPAVVPAKLWPSSNKAKQPLDGKQGVAAAPSRAKARSSSMSPRSRRQSIARLTTNTRGGVAAFGASSSKVADELTPKGVTNHPISSASTCRRPSGSSKVRVVPSRYSLMPGASLGAGTQERRRKDSLPGSVPAILDAGQSEETRATLATEPLDDDTSPESIDKVAELLPRIRTMPPPDETPRDSGCAKRAADLVGKRSFFTAAAGDSSSMSSYQARVLEADEEPEEAAAAEALGNDGEQQE
uniref:Uncharacterized protein n=1 Tax=Avena sativa TaxID=4498 RepID=A0ACD5UHW1_AVESA